MDFETRREMATYDAATKAIYLQKGESLYALAHERAHEAQDRAQTFVWRWERRLRGVPILGAWLRYLVEAEAAGMARRVLVDLGLWTREHAAEMRRGLRSYLRPT